MADNFGWAIRLNNPVGVDKEIDSVLDFMRKFRLNKGSKVILIWDGKLSCYIDDKVIVIESKKFAEAVWSIYFGKNPITQQIKQGLSRGL